MSAARSMPRGRCTFALVGALVFALSLAGFHDFKMPLVMLEELERDSSALADIAATGQLRRRIGLLLLALLGALCLWWSGGRRRPRGLLGSAILAFAAWTFASVLWSEDVALSVRRLGALTCMVVAAYGLSSLDGRQIIVLVMAVCLGGVLVGLANELALGTFDPLSADYRFAGTLHPNAQGVVLATVFLIACGLLLAPGQAGVPMRVSVLLCASLVLTFALLVLTDSRTSLLCLLLALGIFFSVRLFIYNRRRFLVASLIAVAVLSAGLVAEGGSGQAPSQALANAFAKPRDEGGITTLTGRVSVWQTCLTYARKKLFLGYGYESFWTPERIVEISSRERWPINQAHSAYIEQVLSTGLVGLVLYSAVLALGVSASVRRFATGGGPPYLILATLLLFNVVHGFTESTTMMPFMSGFLTMLLLSHLALMHPLPAADGDGSVTRHLQANSVHQCGRASSVCQSH